MTEWFKDKEVQILLTKLLDRLCFLERTGGEETFGSILLLIPFNETLPILFATHGKPFYPYEHLTSWDVGRNINLALKGRLPG